MHRIGQKRKISSKRLYEKSSRNVRIEKSCAVQKLKERNNSEKMNFLFKRKSFYSV